MVSLRRVLVEAAILALREEENVKESEPDPRTIHANSFTDGIVAWLKQTTILLAISFLMLITSFLTFALFYYLVMPPHVLKKPLYFDFSSSIKSITQDIAHEESATPIARADLYRGHTQWQACVAEVAPPQIASHMIHPDRRYFLEVAITLPESEINQFIGIFMVEVSLRDRNETLLAISKRTTMLPYESSLVKAVRKFVLIIPILLGTVTESRTVVVGMFDHFIENIDKPLSSVEVRLIVPNLRAVSSHYIHQNLQIEQAELRIGKELNVLQCVLKQWFYTCAFSFTAVCMTFQALSLLLIWRFYKQRKQLQSQQIRYTSNDFNHDFDIWTVTSGRISLAEDSTSFVTRADGDCGSLEEKEDEKDKSAAINDNSPSDENNHAEQSTAKQTEENKRSSIAEKKSTVSNNKSELRTNQQSENERLLRIIKGDFEPSFHIFTDLDEPD